MLLTNLKASNLANNEEPDQKRNSSFFINSICKFWDGLCAAWESPGLPWIRKAIATGTDAFLGGKTRTRRCVIC